MFGDLVGNAADGFVQLRSYRLDRKSLEADHQSIGEAVHAIAMLPDVLALDVVEYVANFVGGVLMMIQEGNEVGDRPLEVDIVLPERVIGIDEQILARRELFQANGRHVFY